MVFPVSMWHFLIRKWFPCRHEAFPDQEMVFLVGMRHFLIRKWISWSACGISGSGNGFPWSAYARILQPAIVHARYVHLRPASRARRRLASNRRMVSRSIARICQRGADGHSVHLGAEPAKKA